MPLPVIAVAVGGTAVTVTAADIAAGTLLVAAGYVATHPDEINHDLNQLSWKAAAFTSAARNELSYQASRLAGSAEIWTAVLMSGTTGPGSKSKPNPLALPPRAQPVVRPETGFDVIDGVEEFPDLLPESDLDEPEPEDVGD